MCILILLSYYICLMIFSLDIDYPVRHLFWPQLRGSIWSCSGYASTDWSPTQSWVALCNLRSLKDLAYLCNICLNTYGLCVWLHVGLNICLTAYIPDIYIYIYIYINSCLYVGLSIAYPVLRGRRVESHWWR